MSVMKLKMENEAGIATKALSTPTKVAELAQLHKEEN